MINRELIRLKVVQLLYSYLLVDNNFTLESQPSNPTKEKRFAYSLYMDTLALMVEVSKMIKKRGGGYPLNETRFIQRVESDEKMKSLLARQAGHGPFAQVADEIAAKVRESLIYKKFLKNDEPGGMSGERIWQDIFKLIILPDDNYRMVISGLENYTLGGVERMQEMMEGTFSDFYKSAGNLPDAQATLQRSMEKARELYFLLFELAVQLTDLRMQDIEDARNKYLATAEDLNPDLRFVENQFVEAVRNNEEISKYVEDHGLGWLHNDNAMLRSILRQIMASDIYKEYMAFPATDLKRDCEFWRRIYKHVVFANPDFLQSLEDKSVFWNDDLEVIGSFLLKSVKRMGEGDADAVLPMYKDIEDASFGRRLFEAVVTHKDTYRKAIDEVLNTQLWESDRLAYMDVVIMLAAIAEMRNFPEIPVGVTVNEYVEIAKWYSTGKSGQFVNGILAEIIKRNKNNRL